MADKETIIVVGVTREDEYNNLWVTPKGGGDEVKIGEKRSQLHPLFQQGKAVMLHWEIYKGKTYVADAKAVEGELPEPQKSDDPPLQQDEPTPEQLKPFDPTRKSIERQKSLDVAERWCSLKVQSGEDIKTLDVLVVAKVFESYLDTGIVVEKKKK